MIEIIMLLIKLVHSNCSIEKNLVRSGIRTHAQRTGLRPERSALDRSAILTYEIGYTQIIYLLHN